MASTADLAQQILDAVTGENTDVDNLIAFAQNLQAQINGGATPAQLSAILAAVIADRTKLANAVNANVPGNPPVTPTT